MRIDLLTIDEYDALIALWDRCGLSYDPVNRDSREAIEQQMFDDHLMILTLKADDGLMVGSVIGSFDGRKGWINRLAIDPDYRGRRLAARLIDKIEELLAEKGAVIVAALIEDQNFPSMAAFRHCGYEGWDKIVYFRKRLER
jgi:GNAT superfamily N-acetyltransferase